jgi:hypothetical protein
MTVRATGRRFTNPWQCENGKMRVRLALAALLVCACSLAQQTLTVEQLLSFVRSSVKMKMADKELACRPQKLHSGVFGAM